jgi:hypothetical protein
MMGRLFSRFARNDKGATALEFAIILPVLLLFVFGIVEWGLYMYNRQVITNAAREGARHGVLMRAAPRDDTVENNEICARVVDFAGSWLITFGSDGLDCDGNNINIEREPPSSTAFGTDLTVSIDYEYEFLFLFPILGSMTITGEATMKME